MLVFHYILYNLQLNATFDQNISTLNHFFICCI